LLNATRITKKAQNPRRNIRREKNQIEKQRNFAKKAQQNKLFNKANSEC